MSVESISKYKRIQKAREEDTQKARQAVALYLLSQGLDISKITFATGLTTTDIEELKAKTKASNNLDKIPNLE
jgi:hypothetical protein